MDLLKITKISQLVVSCLLICLILIQSKSSGLSTGLKNSFSAYRSLRGVEKVVFVLTLISSVLLVINSLIIVVLS